MLRGYLTNRTTNQRVRIGERMVIGRGVDADLCIDDRVASRSHVEIIREQMGFVWRDLGSHNGTLINGVFETSGRLHDGDHIRIGETDLIFEIEVAGQRMERLQPPQPFEVILSQASPETPLPPDIRKTCAFLDVIYRVMLEITANYDLCRLQDRILGMIMPTIKAQRGAIFLTNDVRQITPCPLCGHIHSFVDGKIAHAERAGLAISTTVTEQVLQDGKCVFYQDCEMAGGASPTESMVALALRSIICVPLRGKTRILGILYIDTDRPEQHYGQGDLLLASAVGVSSGIAIESVVMHNELLQKHRDQQAIETAWTIQEGFLRQNWDFGDGRFEAYGNVVPAKTVGGDFYDFVMVDKDTVAMMVGDISGKGVLSALATAQLIAEFRLLAKSIPLPADLLARINEEFIRRRERGMYCTMTCARLDLNTGVLIWANAGHLPGLFVTPDTNVFHGEASGPPLGILEDAAWKNANHVMESGTTLLYFTDGIIKTRPPEENSEDFGLGRLWGIPDYSEPPRCLIDDVNNALRTYSQGAEARDDCAMLAVRYFGHENQY